MNRIVLCCSLVSAAFLASCSKAGRATPTSDAGAPAGAPATTVAAAKASRANLSDGIVLTAEFEPFQEVDVMAKVAGYVREIKVDIGDRVREGQLLATLDIPEMNDDLAKAGADIEQADAQAAAARDDLRRAEAAHDLAHLYSARVEGVSKTEPGLVPQQDVDEVRSRDLAAEAGVSAAKASVRAAEQHLQSARATEARMKTLYKYATITAPFDGVITKRYANVGSMIQAGTASQSQAMPLVRLSQNNLLRLILPVPESSVPQIRVGEAVEVRVPSLNRTFPGRVARAAETVQMATRTMNTEVDVPNPSLKLVPGLYAEVNLQLERREHALTVPTDAVEHSGDAVRVYVVRDGAIHITRVSIGLESADRVEIRAGLQEGDVVAYGRLGNLREGQRVEPQLMAASAVN